jgi:hypothetical protein
VEPLGEERCTLISYACGRWTMPLAPRLLGRIWMLWVLGATNGILARHFAGLAAARRRAGL